MGGPKPGVDSPGRTERILFWASFFTLIAAGIGFSIRNSLLETWGHQFGFTQSELGAITGAGLWGFPVAIIALSFVVDKLGYGPLMVLAFVLHSLSAVVTLAASAFGHDMAYQCLYWGSFLFALANGTCEAVINPLTATLYPKNKTHYLNILHAGWPGGLVAGALMGLACNALGGVRWEVQMGFFLLPTAFYGALMVGRHFPKSEATASGATLATMAVSLLAPVLLFLFLLHAMVGYVELGTDSWIINITKIVVKNQNLALIAFIWTNILMFTLRFFAGPIVHKISPLGLLFCAAVVGTIGLLLLGMPASYTAGLSATMIFVVWLGAVTVYGAGKTFYWPTMLGVVSERFPKAGALALGLSGGIGMLSAGLLGGPCIGYKQDYAATRELKEASDPTYLRYKATDAGAPLPGLPKIAGLDNAKVGILENYEAIQAKEKAGETLSAADKKLTVEHDLELLPKEGKAAERKDLEARLAWWNDEGKPNVETDYPKVEQARLVGGKQALSWTAWVPAGMALGYMLLILYFRARGGYKAEVLVGHAAEDEEFTGGTEGPGEG